MDPAPPSRDGPIPADRPRAQFASEAEFREAIARARALVTAGVPHAIFVIHVERLQNVIRQCGQEAEEALLETIGRLIERECGPWLAHCRTRVDRIAILKRDCPRHRAVTFAHRICDVLDSEVFRWRGLTFRVGATVGLLELENQPEGVDDLLGRATDACMAARSLGSDGVMVLTGQPGEQARVERERAWRDHIHETLG